MQQFGRIGAWMVAGCFAFLLIMLLIVWSVPNEVLNQNEILIIGLLDACQKLNITGIGIWGGCTIIKIINAIWVR